MIKTPEQKLSRNPQNAGYTNPLKSYDVPAKDNPDGTINVHSQPVFGIDPNHEPIDQYMACRTIPGGTFRRFGANGTAISAGGLRIGTCPVGKRWVLLSVVCDVVCTATVGNRILMVSITTDNNTNDWLGAVSAAVTAGQTGGYDVGFGAPLATPSTAVRRNLANTGNTNIQVRETSSCNVIAATGGIMIDDTADIDNADAVSYRLCVMEYDA